MGSRHADPPVERICALEIADRVDLPFKIPAEAIAARAEGWTVYFFEQPPGHPPVETMIHWKTHGVNLFSDYDARRLWRRCQ